MSIYSSLLIALIGLIMYFVATNGKVSEVGRICFFSGLLAFLLRSPGPVLELFR